jgi:hypothetical protein
MGLEHSPANSREANRRKTITWISLSSGSIQILQVLVVPLAELELELANNHAVPIPSLVSLQHSVTSDLVGKRITLLAVSVRARMVARDKLQRNNPRTAQTRARSNVLPDWLQELRRYRGSWSLLCKLGHLFS